MKTFLLIYFTISTVLLIIWYIIAILYQKAYKKTVKAKVFWLEVLGIIFFWPASVLFKGYVIYWMIKSEEMFDLIDKELEDGFIEDSE